MFNISRRTDRTKKKKKMKKSNFKTREDKEEVGEAENESSGLFKQATEKACRI